MKSLFLLFIFIVMSYARENPFVPTQEFEEEKSRLFEKFLDKQDLDIIKNDSNVYVDESISKKEETKTKPEVSSTNTPKKVEPIKEEPKKVQPKIAQTAQKMQESKSVESVVEEKIPAKEPVQEKIALVKPKNEIKESKDNITLKNETKTQKEPLVASKSIKTGLKFLSMSYTDNQVEIISSKYKVSKKLDIEDENKIVFDFRANTNFKTKRFDLDHKYFKQIAIGNHESEGFFRVVVELKEPINKFESTYSDAKVTVKYK
ncbi:MAG: AMIN domain-containing protein [Arcobacteraceae bacterium]